jgi:hypothetical protein
MHMEQCQFGEKMLGAMLCHKEIGGGGVVKQEGEVVMGPDRIQFTFPR